jgi:hypothetical protein
MRKSLAGIIMVASLNARKARHNHVIAAPLAKSAAFLGPMGSSDLCLGGEFAMFRLGQHCCPNWWPVARAVGSGVIMRDGQPPVTRARPTAAPKAAGP